MPHSSFPEQWVWNWAFHGCLRYLKGTQKLPNTRKLFNCKIKLRWSQFWPWHVFILRQHTNLNSYNVCGKSQKLSFRMSRTLYYDPHFQHATVRVPRVWCIEVGCCSTFTCINDESYGMVREHPFRWVPPVRGGLWLHSSRVCISGYRGIPIKVHPPYSRIEQKKHGIPGTRVRHSIPVYKCTPTTGYIPVIRQSNLGKCDRFDWTQHDRKEALWRTGGNFEGLYYHQCYLPEQNKLSGMGLTNTRKNMEVGIWEKNWPVKDGWSNGRPFLFEMIQELAE
jgi:hypothetical protein